MEKCLTKEKSKPLYVLKKLVLFAPQPFFFVIAWQGTRNGNISETLLGVAVMIYFLMREKAVNNG